METHRNSPSNDRDLTTNRAERNSSIPNDLPDSPQDAEKLKGEETTIDLPDVKDIPGQEFIHVPTMGALADTTISSDDEEGTRVFGSGSRDIDEDAFNVTPEERQALADTEYLPTADEDNPRRATMDNKDFQGEELNEKSFGSEISGSDLDIPENTDETQTDALGQGDEENKYYSLGSDDNDNVTEGTP